MRLHTRFPSPLGRGRGAIALTAAAALVLTGSIAVPRSVSAPCPRVMVIGDSLMVSVANELPGALGCDVAKEAISGTGPVGPQFGVVWADRLPELLQRVRPQVVVMHWLPNYYDVPYDSPAWLPTVAAGVQRLVDQLRFVHARVYIAVPPVADFGCEFNDANALAFTLWAWAVRAHIIRRAKVIDWRAALDPGEDPTPGLHLPDCVHLTDAGARLAAAVTALAIRR